MNNKLSIDEAKIQVKQHLKEFLKQSNIKHNKMETMFQCFYPDHNDRNPSMHIFQSYNGYPMYYCMGCQRFGDIFVANNVINGKPLLGYEFITENMKPLCDQFGIEFETRPLTVEEIEEMNIKSVYRMVKDIITYNLKYAYDSIDSKVKEYIEERKLRDNGDILDYDLGYVHDWNKLKIELMARGINEELLQKIDIKEYIFNSGNLIFSIVDEYGHVRGFSARNCRYDPEDRIGSKYVNTSNNIVYNKRSLLYNLNRAIKCKAGKFNSIYVTEGYTDAIALDKIGLRAVAIGSTKFTTDHISLLQRVGETDIVLLLDGDEAGINNTARTITEVMEGIRNFRTRIVTLPEGLDPDEYIRKYGKTSLLELPHISAFEWRLVYLQAQTDLDNHELAKQVIPLIVNETSELQRDKMCKQLSELTAIPLETIRLEVRKISDDNKLKIKGETEAIVDNIIKGLRRNPENAQIILLDGQNTLRSVAEKHSADIYDFAEYVHELQSIKLKQELTSDEDCLNIFRMPRFEKKMSGSTAGKLFLLGGQPSAGKTSFVINWICGILQAQLGAPHWDQKGSLARENNVCIFYHTVDDSREEVIPRFLSYLAADRHPEVTINHMAAPDREKLVDKEGLLKVRNDAYKTLTKWAQDGRLIIKDASIGANVVSAQNVIQTLKRKYPDRFIIYVCDNVYNMSDFPSISDQSQRIGEILRVVKQDLCVSEKIMALCTVEYKKGSDKINSRQALNELVSGSKGIEYEANWVGHLMNELYTNGDETKMYFWDPSLSIDEQRLDNRCPIIRLIVGKNKVTNFKGELYYYFLDHKATFLEINEKDVAAMNSDLRGIIGNHYYVPDNTIPEKSLDLLPKLSDLHELYDYSEQLN